MNDFLAFVPLGVWVSAAALFATGRIVKKHYALIMASGWTVNTLASVLEHLHFWAYFSAAFAAWELYVWWSNGGGDDTKKRLRKLKRKFTPVRRMAPVTA